jgi:hypothetical protein
MADVENGYQEISSDDIGGLSTAKGPRWAKVGVALLSGSALVLLCIVYVSSGASINDAMLNNLATLPSSRFRMGAKPVSPAKMTSLPFGGTGTLQNSFGSASTASIPSLPFGPSDMTQTGFSHSRNVAAQAAVAKGQTYVIRQPKPLGLSFEEKMDGIYVKRVDSRDADSRVKVGDKLLAVSASFGGEIWPAKSMSQTMAAIKTRAGLVYLKLESGGKSGGGVAGLFGRLGNNAEADRIDDVNEDDWERQVDSVQAIQSITVVAGFIGLGLLAYIASTIK